MYLWTWKTSLNFESHVYLDHAGQKTNLKNFSSRISLACSTLELFIADNITVLELSI